MTEVRESAAPQLIRSTRKAKILLVDDSPDNLLALEAVLSSLGEEIVTAASGEEALRRLLEEDFAVILLDVKMPDMDGFETAALIRERERCRHIPLIFLTGVRSEDQLFRGYCVGAVDYLFKPVVPEVLRAKVSAFVELTRKSELLKSHVEALEAKNRELALLAQECKRAEEEVRRFNATLEERVAERTTELQCANDDLRQFAYIVSHDLQEPLRMITSYTQLLIRRCLGSPDADAEQFASFIVDGVQRMHALLHDVLAYSQASEADKGKWKRISSEDVVKAALQNLDLSIRENEAEINFGPLPVVKGDEVQLLQVMQNLIANGIKYRGEAAPAIHVSAELKDGDWQFSVRDNGIGFDPQYSERIFGLFKRLHGRDLPGTGLGLAICKRIVERHGGRIWCHSQPGVGSEFCFTLPNTPDEAERAQAI